MYRNQIMLLLMFSLTSCTWQQLGDDVYRSTRNHECHENREVPDCDLDKTIPDIKKIPPGTGTTNEELEERAKRQKKY